MIGKKALTCALGLFLFGYAPSPGINTKLENNNSNSFNEVQFELPKRDSLEFCLDSAYNFNESDLNKFNSWIDSTINASRINKNYAIIINKSEYKLFLYKDGMRQLALPVDLGRNPYDDKKMQGDKTTPEGMYKVAVKIPEGKSRFYKGLVINYPDARDSIEFKELLKSGVIPLTSQIGGSIAIHGNGSGIASSKYPCKWTHGCSALSDGDMDKIYDSVPVGTPVTIVRYTDKQFR